MEQNQNAQFYICFRRNDRPVKELIPGSFPLLITETQFTQVKCIADVPFSWASIGMFTFRDAQ
jgi:hypothetical protein